MANAIDFEKLCGNWGILVHYGRPALGIKGDGFIQLQHKDNVEGDHLGLHQMTTCGPEETLDHLHDLRYLIERAIQDAERRIRQQPVTVTNNYTGLPGGGLSRGHRKQKEG